MICAALSEIFEFAPSPTVLFLREPLNVPNLSTT